MGFNPRLGPYSLTYLFEGTTPGADEIFELYRFPVAGQFINAYATNSSAIATATNTLALFVTKSSSAATPVIQGTLASFAAGVDWVADITRTGTKTAFGSTALAVAGEHVKLEYDETSTGTWTEMGFQVDYVLGYETGETPTAATEPA
jgi:hypothetical protein